MSITRSAALCVVLAQLPRPAAAATPGDDPILEAAKVHFLDGNRRYGAGDFSGALREFQVAQKLRPAPAFDFNIARCLERLQRWADAADAYERYLQAEPSATDRESVVALIAKMRARLVPPKRIEPPPKRPQQIEPPVAQPIAAPPQVVERSPARGRLVPVLVGAGAVAAVVVAAGLLGSVSHDFGAMQSGCGAGAGCPDDQVDSLVARADAGWAMLAAAGALAIVDAILWVRALRR